MCVFLFSPDRSLESDQLFELRSCLPMKCLEGYICDTKSSSSQSTASREVLLTLLVRYIYVATILAVDSKLPVL